MSDTIRHFVRARDHLSTVTALCSTVDHRIKKGEVSSQWLLGIMGLIQSNAEASARIIDGEITQAIGVTADVLDRIENDVVVQLQGPTCMEVKGQTGNIVTIGRAVSRPSQGGKSDG